MKWQDKLTEWELDHLKIEGGIKTLESAKRTFEQQHRMRIENDKKGLTPGIAEPCWDCLIIARKLGFRNVKYGGRGGPRKGAGRPKGQVVPDRDRRERLGIRLPAWMVDWLRSQPLNPGQVIEAALWKTHRKELKKEKGV